MPSRWWSRRCGRAGGRRTRAPTRSVGPDAFELADALRLGAIHTKVYKERGRFGELGYRARGYRWTRDDVVRVKNRLKSVYRSRGVQVAGPSVYTAAKRGEFLNRLPRSAQPLAELLYAELDALEALKREAQNELLAEAKRHPERTGNPRREERASGRQDQALD